VKLSKLGHALPTIRDSRTALSPWQGVEVELPDGSQTNVDLFEGGLNFSLVIYRQGRYVDAKQPFIEFLKEAQGGSPFAKAILKASLKFGAAASGQRRRRGVGRAANNRMIDDVLDQTDLSGVTETDELAKIKPGVAKYLMGQMHDVLDADNNPVPDSEEGRMSLLRNPVAPDGTFAWLPREVCVTVAGFGEIKVDVPYGDRPVGDAITAWILDEAESSEDFLAEAVAEAGDALAASPDSGSGATES
jgi:hypothetical protein